MKGIKFNQDGLIAILKGRKNMTRRPIKHEVSIYSGYETDSIASDDPGWCFIIDDHEYGFLTNELIKKFCKYKIGETVFVSNEAIVFSEDDIFLKITNIKVERLQDISEEDCLKEGGEVACMSCDELYPNCKCTSPDYDNYKDVFRYDIWNVLPYQTPYNWNSNPYVFVYEFEAVK